MVARQLSNDIYHNLRIFHIQNFSQNVSLKFFTQKFSKKNFSHVKKCANNFHTNFVLKIFRQMDGA